MNQEWRPVTGYEGAYEVSDLGQVRNCRIKRYGPRGDYLRPQMAGHLRYQIVNLHANRQSKVHLIHRLVTRAFLGPCPVEYEVNHKDGNRLNNRLDNLEYVTGKQNHQHAARVGLTLKGQRNPLAKLSDQAVQYIRQSECSERDLAKRFAVSQSAIHLARIGETWRHVLTPSRRDGLPHGEKNHSAKLTETQVKDIRQTQGSCRAVAHQFGVCEETIRLIRNKRAWKHVT